MSIRQGVYRIGETVEMLSDFTDSDGQPMNPTGLKLYIRKPDQSLETMELTAVDNAIAVDIQADMVGTWKTRLEWTAPTAGNKEGRFEVVASTVL